MGHGSTDSRQLVEKDAETSFGTPLGCEGEHFDNESHLAAIYGLLDAIRAQRGGLFW